MHIEVDISSQQNKCSSSETQFQFPEVRTSFSEV